MDIEARLKQSLSGIGDVDASGRSEWLPPGLHKVRLKSVDLKIPQQKPNALALIIGVEIEKSNNVKCSPGTRWSIYSDDNTVTAKENQNKRIKQLVCAIRKIDPKDPKVTAAGNAEKAKAILKKFMAEIVAYTKNPPQDTFRVDSTEILTKQGKPFTLHELSSCEESWDPGSPVIHESAAPSPVEKNDEEWEKEEQNQSNENDMDFDF